MGLSTAVNRNNYVGNGTADTFAYGFRILSKNDLQVIVTKTSTGVETTLVVDTDYSVAGVGDDTGTISLLDLDQAYLDSDGDLNTGYELSIRRVRALTQTFDFRNQGNYFPETHENAFDHCVMIDQQQQDEIDRSIKAPDGEDAVDMTIPTVTERASKYAAYNSDGEPIASSAAVDTAPLSAFVETLVGAANAAAFMTALGISAFAQTLLDDTTAANARTTLGATAGLWGSSTLGDGAATGAKRLLTISTEKTGSYTALVTDDVIRVNPDSASFDVTMFAANAKAGKAITFLHTGSSYSNVCRIIRAGSDTIGRDSATAFNMTRPGTRITLVADGTSNFILKDVFIPQSMDNWLLNGAMDYTQDLSGSSYTSVSASKYLADQWAYLLAGSSGVVSLIKATDVPTYAQSGYAGTNSFHVDVTTADASIAAGDLAAVVQPVIGEDYANLYGKVVTLAFWVKATKTGTYCVSFRNNGRDRSYVAEYTVNTTNTWERKSITLVINPSGGTDSFTRSAVGLWVGFTIAGGSTYQTTANAWQTGNFHCTSNQVNGLDSTSNDFKLTQVQLVMGNEAYAYRRYGKTAGDELQALESFYQKSYNIATAPGSVSTVGAHGMRVSSSLRLDAKFRTRMITTPTFNAYSTQSGAIDNVYNIDGAADAAATYANTGETGATVLATVSDAQSAVFQWVATARFTPA